MMKKILVGGGTGFIGRYLKPRLETCGYDVINISRSPNTRSVTWDQIESSGLPAFTNAVVNLTGHNIMDFKRRWNNEFKTLIKESRITPTQILSNAIKSSNQKPKVFVLVTGVGAYDTSDHHVYDESQCTNYGTNFFSKLVKDWERAAWVPPPVRLVIIRSGVVLGRTGGIIDNMYIPFLLGLGGKLGSGKQYLPWIHVTDLVRLIKFAIENDNVVGFLHGVAPQQIRNEDFTKAFAKALHRPAVIPVPEVVLNTLLGAERAVVMTQGHRIVPQRVLNYGFEYKFDNIDKACKEVVS